jgi:AcrR family transcriptional regulator
MSDGTVGRPRSIDPEEVSLVALRLFEERGYEAVSMDEVARAARISRRSLFRLFPTKGALVWGGLDGFGHRLAAALDTADPSGATEDAVRSAFRAAATFPPESVEVTRHRLRIIRANPALAAERPRAGIELAGLVAGFIADREGLAPDDLAVQVRGALVGAAASTALFWWSDHSQEAPEVVVDRALRVAARAPE